MATREDSSLRRNLTSALPPKRIRSLAREVGAVQRQRKVDIVALVYALALGFSVGNQRSLAGLRRAYERVTGTTLAPSAFYGRLSHQLARLLQRLVLEALAKLSQQRPRLAGALRAFREVLVVDSTLLRVHDALEETFAGTYSHMPASAKLTVVMNVIGRGAKRLKIAAGRSHELRMLRVGRWMRDKLLIFDRGFFQCEMFAQVGHYGGFFLSRLRGRANPLLLKSYQTGERALVGCRFREALPQLRAPTADFEAEFRYRIQWGPTRSERCFAMRLVGVRDEQGEYRWYLTNAPRAHLQARNIAAVYAARWEIELLFRELKVYYRIEQLPTSRRDVTECLFYAALLTMVLARRLRDWLATARPAQAGRFNFDRCAVLLSAFAHDVLDILLGPPLLRRPLATRLKRLLLHEAADPNLGRRTLPELAQSGLLMPHAHRA